MSSALRLFLIALHYLAVEDRKKMDNATGQIIAE